jgi:hypothetical protein
MHKIARLLVLVLTLSTFGACTHGRIVSVPTVKTANNEPNGSGLQMEVDWVKIKGTKNIDMKISLTNKYNHWVSFKRENWKLVFNGQTGFPSKFDFSGGLDAGVLSTNVVSFKFDENQKGGGHGVLIIDPIYGADNENSANRTKLPPMKYEFDVTK